MILKGFEGSRIQRFEWNAKNSQRVESLAKVIWTLFRDIWKNVRGAYKVTRKQTLGLL